LGNLRITSELRTISGIGTIERIKNDLWNWDIGTIKNNLWNWDIGTIKDNKEI